MCLFFLTITQFCDCDVMSSLIERIVFPEINGRHLLFMEHDEDGDDIFNRRTYRILNRAKMNDWDDIEFYQRFRFTKPFFHRILALVTPALARDMNR